MKGPELRERRKRLGYTQQLFMEEIGVKSRQTLVSWEQSEEELPRLVELALLALERLPESRYKEGKPMIAPDRKELKRRPSWSATVNRK